MRDDYQELKRHWGGFAGYDDWFGSPINNAKLTAVAIYRGLVPDFERLLTACGGDFERFYRQVEQLTQLELAERHAQLNLVQSCS